MFEELYNELKKINLYHCIKPQVRAICRKFHISYDDIIWKYEKPWWGERCVRFTWFPSVKFRKKLDIDSEDISFDEVFEM